MTEFLLVVYVLLSVFAFGIAFLSYRRLREGSRQYLKAKRVLDDTILSINSDLKAQAERVRALEEQDQAARAEDLRAIEDLRSEIGSVRTQLTDLSKTDEGLLGSYDALRTRMDTLASQGAEIMERVGRLESAGLGSAFAKGPEESAVPIGKEKAIASLTVTELSIVELLAAEGEKTAPQIRERIGLTREHTARLMKKLFASGYVERATGEVPYRYRLKKEMVDILEEQGSGG